ncbi:MAG: Mrp/NBP35 family ATP-binding protein, partial [Rhodothermia bacterium]|nr:Mrp/NBP35 family ATP-binding protein [Rhodothermia bacterium]
DVTFLGRVPMDPRMAWLTDRGLNFLGEHGDRPAAQAVGQVARSVEKLVASAGAKEGKTGSDGVTAGASGAAADSLGEPAAASSGKTNSDGEPAGASGGTTDSNDGPAAAARPKTNVSPASDVTTSEK